MSEPVKDAQEALITGVEALQNELKPWRYLRHLSKLWSEEHPPPGGMLQIRFEQTDTIRLTFSATVWEELLDLHRVRTVKGIIFDRASPEELAEQHFKEADRQFEKPLKPED